ncbi:VOC family protein [Christiangramia sp.]|uniref:VOC family protein n=1 Tax=Christiangramia sp. TaxID=1931228 RepID=UPI00261A29BC|nr:VOC family protein [Christiangramia sp.]
MRTRYILIFTLLFMAISNAQSNQFQLNKDHDAIQVKDLKASAKFYGDVLGLKEIPNGGLPAHIRWFQLGNAVQIHLIESDSIPENQKGVHMALNTNNLQEVMKFLKEKDIHFENWTGEVETTNTRPDGIKQIYLQDPDGYWIEINDGSL